MVEKRVLRDYILLVTVLNISNYSKSNSMIFDAGHGTKQVVSRLVSRSLASIM